MTMQEGIDISFWCSHPKLLDAVSKETLSCDSKSDGIFIVYYPEDGGFIPESTCYPSFHEDNVCSIFQGKMVLISKSALKSNKRNEDMAIIHDFMNNLADPDSNNIYSSQYLGPAFYQKSSIHVGDKFAIALSISLGILVLLFAATRPWKKHKHSRLPLE
jgi:hypothetical protein